MRLRKGQKGEGPRWKLLLWTAVAALIFGLIGAGELPEDMLRASRNSLHVHKASGDIVLVAIDDQSLREVGRWPWPRRRHAEIINKLNEAGAKRTVRRHRLQRAQRSVGRRQTGRSSRQHRAM